MKKNLQWRAGSGLRRHHFVHGEDNGGESQGKRNAEMDPQVDSAASRLVERDIDIIALVLGASHCEGILRQLPAL